MESVDSDSDSVSSSFDTTTAGRGVLETGGNDRVAVGTGAKAGVRIQGWLSISTLGGVPIIFENIDFGSIKSRIEDPPVRCWYGRSTHRHTRADGNSTHTVRGMGMLMGVRIGSSLAHALLHHGVEGLLCLGPLLLTLCLLSCHLSGKGLWMDDFLIVQEQPTLRLTGIFMHSPPKLAVDPALKSMEIEAFTKLIAAKPGRKSCVPQQLH